MWIIPIILAMKTEAHTVDQMDNDKTAGLKGVWYMYEIWLWSSWTDFIESISVYLQIWNSFQCHRHISYIFNILKYSSLHGKLYFWKQLEVIRSQVRWTVWVFHYTNRYLGQKLFARERLVRWSTVMVENPIIGPKFRPFCIRVTFFFCLSLFALHGIDT